MKSNHFILLVLTFFLTGCSEDKSDFVPECDALTINSDRVVSPGDSIGIDSVWVNGYCLNFSTKYTGGCKTHSFDLIWDGALVNYSKLDDESFEPTNSTYLIGDSNGFNEPIENLGDYQDTLFIPEFYSTNPDSTIFLAKVYLNHNANEDACEAFLMRDLFFDISPLVFSNSSKIFIEVEGISSPILFEF